VINAFNKRFPEIKVEMVRAPGGQLITRVKTEAAAGKLIADVVDHSDRALMLPLVDLFQDYAPPNAADYNPAAQISPKLWPRATLVWSSPTQRTVKNPPKSWMDLTKPEYDKLIGQVFAQSGGTTWTRISSSARCWARINWAKAGRDPSGPLSVGRSDGGFAGTREIAIGLCSTMRSTRSRKTARRSRSSSPEGAPVNPYATGIPKTAAHPMPQSCS